MTKKPILIVGGGAAGILAAIRASQLKADVVLLEKNRKLGIKILISGGGKCNITHDGDMQSIGEEFATNEARFLRPSFHRYSNRDILRLLNDGGVETFSRPNGRVFPKSGIAGDVLEVLKSALTLHGVDIRCDSPVESIFQKNGRIAGVIVHGKAISSDQVILATGGVSYSKTGTTGDGYAWAKALGHTIVPLRAALAPIKVAPSLPSDWRGIALREGQLSVWCEGRKIFSWDDDVLITHEGISGPATLEVSKVAAVHLENHEVHLKFDFLPSMEEQDVDRDILEMVRQHPDRQAQTYVERWLPNRIVPTALGSAGIDPATKGYNLRKEERRIMVSLLKSWHLGRVDSIDIDRGEVTAGGVDLSEVDPKTMRSRKTDGLYICGEILDIAGPVGGYNLQAAFSTGYVAGETAALDWLEQNPNVHTSMKESHGRT